MNNKTTLGIIVAIVLIAVYVYFLPTFKNARPSDQDISVADPYNSGFVIDGANILLSGGKAEAESENASITSKVTIFGDPVLADINGDGENDSLVFLTKNVGDRGTFYYLGATLHSPQTDAGNPVAYLLGDRVEPVGITVENNVIEVTYKVRKAGEPITMLPTVTVTKQLVFSENEFTEYVAHNSSGTSGKFLTGMIHIKGEIRDFTPCGETQARWILSDSPAFDVVVSKYNALDTAKTGKPVYAVITASQFGSPTSGAGQNYVKSLQIETVVTMNDTGTCAAAL